MHGTHLKCPYGVSRVVLIDFVHTKNDGQNVANLRLFTALYCASVSKRGSKRDFVLRMHAHSLTHMHRLLKVFEVQVSNRSH